MNRDSLNKKSLYQEGGTIPKSSANPAINELTQIVKARIDSGEPAEQVLYSFLQEGMPEDQLALAFESVGYDPSSFRQLVQNVEQMAMQMEQSQQMDPNQTSANDTPNSSKEELMQELEQATSQQEMQYGGSSNNTVPRPLYLPPPPVKGNMLGAAFLLDDAASQLFGKSDRNKDGLMDGTFKDWSAKRARYKDKQLGNRSYEVDYGDSKPDDYVVTAEDLAAGKLKTKKQFADDTLKYSRLDFDPGTNQYTGALLSSENQSKMIGKNQLKDSIGLQDFITNIADYSEEDKQMVMNAMNYGQGQGMFMTENNNFASYSPDTQKGLPSKEREQQQKSFKDIMLGNQKLSGEFEKANDAEALDFRTWNEFRNGGSLKKYQFAGQPKPGEELDLGVTVPDISNFTKDPTITRKRNIGNVYDQTETFIKENPAMRAFGDVSEFAVMGANFANEMFQQKEFNEYRDKLRNTTTADNVYSAVEDPVNKRGTFDVNMGLAEPDNLVDYYAQAMYGKELYKKGGEFAPHMMYDPVSGEAYEAKVEADHNRFAKMGFVHEDEMQKGGEVEVDNDTLAALIAAGADIEML